MLSHFRKTTTSRKQLVWKKQIFLKVGSLVLLGRDLDNYLNFRALKFHNNFLVSFENCGVYLF